MQTKWKRRKIKHIKLNYVKFESKNQIRERNLNAPVVADIDGDDSVLTVLTVGVVNAMVVGVIAVETDAVVPVVVTGVLTVLADSVVNDVGAVVDTETYTEIE